MPRTASTRTRAAAKPRLRAGAKTARAAAAPRTAARAQARSKAKAGAKMITIVQIRSGIGCNVTHKRTLRALGLRHPHQRVVRPDNPAVRGMVGAIPHLVQIVEEAHG